MSRPSRHLEALQILKQHYKESGVLPTIEVLAAKMGYKSTSSAHNAIQPLLKDGTITQEVSGGRLIPGRGFSPRKSHKPYPELGGASIGEFLDTKGQDTSVIEITNTSLQGEGILKGDFLLVSTSAEPQAGDQLLVQNKRSFRLEPFHGQASRQRPIGVVLAQFRKYRP